jgi:hypothetical protein
MLQLYDLSGAGNYRFELAKMNIVNESHSDSVGAAAPAKEIEVTPEMIEAGAAKLLWFDTNDNDHFRIVREVLAAMEGCVFPAAGRPLRRNMALAVEEVYRLRVPTLEELFPNR